MGCYCRTKTPVGGAIFLAHGIMPPMQHNQAAPVTVPATVPTAAAITVYGIAQCDTVKKARAWLAEQALDYHWHDFKKQGVPQALLEQCLQQFGRDALINRKGTTGASSMQPRKPQWWMMPAPLPCSWRTPAPSSAPSLIGALKLGKGGTHWAIHRSSGSQLKYLPRQKPCTI